MKASRSASCLLTKLLNWPVKKTLTWWRFRRPPSRPFAALDYGKYLYQQEKKEREAKKHQKTITVKEVKFRINVDDHDYETKKNHVIRFLEDGDKVKATIFFRGREMTRTGLGREILERLIKDVEQKGMVEFRPRQEGNTLHAILAPKKEGSHKAQPAQPAQDRLKQA